MGGPRGLPAAESGLLPWRMAAPISRAVAVAGSRKQLIVVGGLAAGGASASGIYALRTSTGAARQIGVLSAPLHDAAAAVSGGRVLVFGGGSSATVAKVQAFAFPRPAAGARPPPLKAGSMPAPRSDAVAVTIGATDLSAGWLRRNPARCPGAGHHGRPDDSGRSPTLPDPRALPGSRCAGRADLRLRRAGHHRSARPVLPVNTIQAVNPARHSTAVIGHLPEPLAGAAAVTVGSELFVSRRRQPCGPAADSWPRHDPARPGESSAGTVGESASLTHVDRLDDLGLRPGDQATAAGWPSPGAGLPCRGRRGRRDSMDRRRRIQRRAGRRRSDASSEPGFWDCWRSWGRLAVFRRQAARRRPRQQPAPAPGRANAPGVEVPVIAVPRAIHCAFTFPMTHSSSTAARPSCPTRSRTRRSSRSPIHPGRSSGLTAIPVGRAPLRDTCTSPTTPICSRTARSRWLMLSTAGC